MMRNLVLRIVAVTAAVIVIAAACGGDDDGGATSAPPPAPEPARDARERDVVFAGRPLRTPVLDRNGLEIGDAVAGPAIVEESTATTLVPPGWQAAVIEGGHLSMTKEAGA